MLRLGFLVLALIGLTFGTASALPVKWSFFSENSDFAINNPGVLFIKGTFIFDPVSGTPSDGFAEFSIGAAGEATVEGFFAALVDLGPDVEKVTRQPDTRSAATVLVADATRYVFLGDDTPDLNGALVIDLAFDPVSLNNGANFVGTTKFGLCSGADCSQVIGIGSATLSTTFTVASVPLPASMLLLGSAIGALGLYRRRRSVPATS